jgi:hypothetical protein
VQVHRRVFEKRVTFADPVVTSPPVIVEVKMGLGHVLHDMGFRDLVAKLVESAKCFLPPG